MIDDSRLEGDLRATLARRDPGAMPGHLATTVIQRLGSESERRWSFGVTRRLAGVGSVAAVMAVALVIASLGSFRLVGPGAAYPTPVPAAGLRPGDGIVSGEFVPFLQLMVWLAAMGAVVLLVLRSRARVLTVAGTVAVVGLVWVALSIGSSDAVVDDGMVASVDLYDRAEISDAEINLRIEGDQLFRTIVVLENHSRLPLELRGMAQWNQPSDLPPLGPRFVGLAALPDNAYAYEASSPFAPVTIAPNGFVGVVLLGMTGLCASDHGDGGRYGLKGVSLVYEQLTLVHTAYVPLHRPIWVAARASCGSEDFPSATP